MPKQAPLFGVPPEECEDRNPHEHIFFALIPDPPIVRQALSIGEDLNASQQLRERLRPGHLLHVTLCALPGYGNSDMKDAYAKAALATASSLQYPETSVFFDRATPFGAGAYVLTGENERVIGLGKSLGVLLRRAGIPSRQTHTPHMTLLYSERQLQACSISPLAWTAREIVLIRSYPGESRHERLGAVGLTKP